MDSVNFKHMDGDPSIIPTRCMDRCYEKVMLGMKAAEKWSINMTIQSFFDVRAFLAKLAHILTVSVPSLSITRAYTSGWILNFMRYFYYQTHEAPTLEYSPFVFFPGFHQPFLKAQV